MGWRDGLLLGFDLETTGLDIHDDVPVQVGLVWCTVDGVVREEGFLVNPGRDIPDESIAVHGISTRMARTFGCGLEEAAWRLHAALRQATAEGVPIVAMNASFDVTISEELFASVGLPALAWTTMVDPLVIDRHVVPVRFGGRSLRALCEYYGVVNHTAHDAVSDACAAVTVACQMAKYFPELDEDDVADLTVRQRRWHKEWAIGQDIWLRSTHDECLEPEEFVWPCRRPARSQVRVQPRVMPIAV